MAQTVRARTATQLDDPARYPNTGWLCNDQGTATTLQDAGLCQSSGY
ncbi:MAG: hypothetical protein IPH53_02375 [Flavobacteriales bacterium]|nr:hypothetical protein [Flavobacteriales bacterium]